MDKMENTSQTSLEYLIMLGLVTIIAALAILLTARIFTMKTSLKSTIQSFRNKILQIE